ncbi:MAG: exonuclease SbcCD subunit D [Deltaproteobacteria bacterium]|nr:exonuclease SbcCD subunit D [Deltaproteobacteria bacterium]
MRVVHTSDWHAGRLWKRLTRLGELERALGSLVGYVERERVDLVLMTGDVFDSGSPSAEAERLVFDVLKRLGRVAPVIVIAGNHDDPRRLEAWGQLAELANIKTLGRPRPARAGGVMTVKSLDGREAATVAAVPFAPLRDFVTAADVAGDEGQMRSLWTDGLTRVVRLLSESFAADTVNLLMAHTHVDGAVLAHSERVAQVGREYALSPEVLPRTAQYVALGHIHKPQAVRFGVEYAGSPIQLDFGEEGEEKSFVVIEARPRLPPVITRVPYEGGTPLVTWQGRLEALEAAAAGLRDKHARIRLELDVPDPEVAKKVRALVPEHVGVQVILPVVDPTAEAPSRAGQSATELFVAYHERRYKRAPEPPLVAAFTALWDEAESPVEATRAATPGEAG